MISFIGCVLATCCIGVLVMALTAPEGYQDDRGFHYGKKPEGISE